MPLGTLNGPFSPPFNFLFYHPMAFENDVSSALLANKQKRDAANASATPATVTPAATITEANIKEISVSSAAPVEQVNKDTAVPVTKKPDEATTPEKQQTPETSAKESTDTSKTEEQEEFKWDEGIPDTTNTTTESKATVQTDLKKIGSALNLEVKDEQQFISTVSEKLTKLTELEKLSLDGVPDELKQAIEVAKKGGDWLEYTRATSFDATTLKPEELFDHEYERANIARFKRPDGTVDVEALDQELDAIPAGLKLMEGNRLKAALVQQQQFKKAQVLAQTTAQQEAFQKSIAAAAQELSKLVPQDQFGVVIEPKHSAYFYQGVADGSLIKKHLGNIDPTLLAKLDGKKLMKTLVIAELGEKISTLRYKQGETAGKKSLLKDVTNPQVQGPSYSPRAEQPEPAPELKSSERLQQMKERQQPKGSL